MADFDTKRTWGPTPAYPKVKAYVPKLATQMLTIAGPCSIECADQVDKVCQTLQQVGVTYMRGGVFRAGTYPKDTFGLQTRLLREWAEHLGLVKPRMRRRTDKENS